MGEVLVNKVLLAETREGPVTRHRASLPTVRAESINLGDNRALEVPALGLVQSMYS